MAKAKAATKTEKTSYYKHPTFGHVYGSKIVTPLGRLSWPYLTKPKDGMEQADGTKSAPRYEVTVLLPKADDKSKEFQKKILHMAEGMIDVFNEGKKGAKLSLDDIEPWKDETEFDKEKYPYYQGMGVLVARNASLPNLISIDKNQKGEYVALPAEHFVSGHLVRLVVTPLITVHGLSYKLNDLQYVKDDGVRYGGGLAERSEDLLAEADSDGSEDENDSMSLAKAAGIL